MKNDSIKMKTVELNAIFPAKFEDDGLLFERAFVVSCTMLFLTGLKNVLLPPLLIVVNNIYNIFVLRRGKCCKTWKI